MISCHANKTVETTFSNTRQLSNTGKMTKTQAPQPRPITYRDSGVDIDAGNRLVKAIKPLAEATSRVGTMGSV